MILLGFSLEAISFICSYILNNTAIYSSVLDLTKNGYKINYDIFQKYLQQAYEKSQNNKILNTLLLFIPGVNLANSFMKRKKMKEEFINDPLIQENKIIMTDSEKEQYSKLKNTYQKLFFTYFMYVNDVEGRELTFNGLEFSVIDNNLLKLNEKLVPLAYTLDEVKRLNELTGCSYRLGKVDGINTAVIGIPNSEYEVLRINYDYDDPGVTHDFENINLDEAQNKTFIVYLFSKDENIKDEVNKEIENIKNKRREQHYSNVLVNEPQIINEDVALVRVRRR